MYTVGLSHLVDCLESLATDAFLRRPGRQNPILPEPAYLQDKVVQYADDRQPQDDFPALQDVLKMLEMLMA